MAHVTAKDLSALARTDHEAEASLVQGGLSFHDITELVSSTPRKNTEALVGAFLGCLSGNTDVGGHAGLPDMEWRRRLG
jgi:N-acetylneuraminic acid mutarotase